MKISTITLLAGFTLGLIATPLFAADSQPNDAEMMAKMMELAQPGEQHKLLAQLAGDWTDEVKMWMAPGQPPLVSTGTCTRKAIVGGHYFAADFKGTM